MKVLCYGSLNIDYVYAVDHFVRKGETLSSTELKVFTGGKGLNQSVALGKAGAEVYHAGAIGPDGRFLLDTMEAAGVDISLVSVLEDARSGNAIIQRDKDGDNCILLYGGTNRLITDEQADRALEGFSAGDFLILQNEINNLPYIMEQAHGKGMRIVLNPSPMDEKILALPLEYVDIFMLNEIEAGQLLQCDAAQEQYAALLQERFPEAAIVLTLGCEGAIYADSECSFRQGAYAVPVADTTAAGDTFTGYFIGSLLKGMSKQEAMQNASAAAAIACSRHGAAPSIPSADEVAEFLQCREKL